MQIERYETASEPRKSESAVKQIERLLGLLEKNKQTFDDNLADYKAKYGSELKGYSSDYEELVARGKAVLEDWEKRLAQK